MKKSFLTVTYMAGALLILVAAVLVMERVAIGKYLFAIGAAMYILTKFQQQYTGDDFRLKRLNRNNLINAFLLVGISYLQFKTLTAWVVLLFLVALLEMYTSFRQVAYEKEIEKEAADKKAAASQAPANQPSAPENTPSSSNEQTPTAR
ncbi:MAG: hypothetical protein GX619_04395 [Bacteroidales bacterium]|nr:hypothetical protein [Bacteroidales bacterium]